MRKLGRHVVDRAFDQTLQHAEMPVSKNVWAGIQSELEKDELRRKLFWYRSLAVASLALLMGLGTWMLAWQTSGSGSNASDLSTGKALKPWHLTFGERPCVTNDVNIAETNAAQALDPTTNNLPSDAFTAAPRKRNRQVNTQLTWAAAPIKGLAASNGKASELPQQSLNVLQAGIDKAAQNLDAIRSIVRSKQPQVLPSIADRGLRPAQTLHVQDNALMLSANVTPRAAEKRREKEFAFSLEDETPSTKSQKRWELGAGFAPDITFASTTPVEQQVAKSARIIANDPTEANTNRLSPVTAYATTVRAAYEVSDRLSLRAGMTYTNRVSSTSEAVSSYGKVSAYNSTLNLSTMELPVSVRYDIVQNKNFDYYVTSGLSGTFLLHYANTQVTSAGNVAARRASDGSDVMRPSQGSVLLSTGMRYRIVDRLSLQVEPGMRYGLLTNEYAFSQTKPLSMNLLTGLNYHF